jgi:hypothetical protein
LPTMTHEWRHTGAPEEHVSDALRRAAMTFERELAEATRRRDHYWLALVGFRVTPPLTDGAVLDHENIRVPPNVGCFICEEPWTPDAPRRCPGEP